MASASVGRPSATLAANTARQPKPSTSRPPISGPAANASPIVAPQAPIARRRAGPWNASARIASEAGNTTAAAMPWIRRAAISAPADGASAHSAEAALNRPRPPRNSFRRPKRSARLPAVSRNTASASAYPLSTHWRSAKLASSASAIADSATCGAATLSSSSAVETHTTRRVQRWCASPITPASLAGPLTGTPALMAATRTRAPRARAKLLEYVDAYVENDLLTYASAISFQILSAIVPFLLFGFGLLGFLHLDEV